MGLKRNGGDNGLYAVEGMDHGAAGQRPLIKQNHKPSRSRERGCVEKYKRPGPFTFTNEIRSVFSCSPMHSTTASCCRFASKGNFIIGTDCRVDFCFVCLSAAHMHAWRLKTGTRFARLRRNRTFIFWSCFVRACKKLCRFCAR